MHILARPGRAWGARNMRRPTPIGRGSAVPDVTVAEWRRIVAFGHPTRPARVSLLMFPARGVVARLSEPRDASAVVGSVDGSVSARTLRSREALSLGCKSDMLGNAPGRESRPATRRLTIPHGSTRTSRIAVRPGLHRARRRQPGRPTRGSIDGSYGRTRTNRLRIAALRLLGRHGTKARPSRAVVNRAFGAGVGPQLPPARG